MNDTNLKIEYFIKSKLAEKGLKLKDCAEILKMSPQNLTQKLKRNTLTYNEALKVAAALGYKIEWLKDYSIHNSHLSFNDT